MIRAHRRTQLKQRPLRTGGGLGKPLLRALGFLAPHKREAAGAFVSLALSSVGSLAIPRLTQAIIDQGIASREMAVILWGAAGMIIAALLQSLFSYLQRFLAARASQGVAYDLRNALYAHIQSLSFSYHDRAQTGQLLTRATSDVELVRTFIGMGVLQLFSALLMMVGSLTLLFSTSWQLTLISLPIMLSVLAVFGFFAGKGRPLFILVQQTLGRLNTVLQENLAGVRVVKAFARESFEMQRFGVSNQELRDINVRVGKMFALAMPLIFVLANLGTLSVVWGGGYQVIAGRLTIGELVAFQSYLMMTMFPMFMLGMIVMSVSQAGAGAERVFEILDAESEVKEKPNAQELPPIHGRVAFEKVTFRYFRDQEPVLREVSFVAEPGQGVALLGATGSGKSTIINLIPRFYDVSEGRVTVDGHDVRHVSQASLRRQMGIVLQDTFLFSGTVMENIRYGRLDASDEEVIAAAKLANAHDFITRLPAGYQTELTEQASNLSQGQRQLISIARAVLANPRILILDEATSSVDTRTELLIQSALRQLLRGRTSFVIAHRLSTICHADQVLFIQEGRIAERGTHQELLAKQGAYYELYMSQFRRDEEAEPANAEN